MSSFKLMCLLIGLIVLLCGIWIIVRKKNCTILTQGVFVRYTEFSLNMSSSYYYTFKYNFNSMNFERQSFDVIYKRQLQSMTTGNVYPIFVNPKHPTDFVLDKGIKFGDVLMIGIGIIFLIAILLIP